jgi:hypothetical protein
VSEQESERGGPDYGGDRGGESAGSEGGQGGQGEAKGESVGSKSRSSDPESAGVGGRGPTERDGEPTTKQGSDASPTKSAADRAKEKETEMEESGEELPG